MAVTYEYPRPALTTDCVVFGFDGKRLKVLLIRRDREPFAGRWAFPGGFVNLDETLEQGARRELEEETRLRLRSMEQFHTFDAVNRDPRERVISVAHLALISLQLQRVEAADDARDVAWFAVDDVPSLAFDHAEILRMALQRLRDRARTKPMGRGVLEDSEFTMRQLQDLYESVWGRNVDRSRFREAILATGVLHELIPLQGTHPDAYDSQEFVFNQQQYDEKLRSGFWLDL